MKICYAEQNNESKMKTSVYMSARTCATGTINTLVIETNFGERSPLADAFCLVV